MQNIEVCNVVGGWGGGQGEDLHVAVDTKIIKQVDSFCTLGRNRKEAVRWDRGGSIPEAVMWDRKLKKQVMGKCLKPAWYQLVCMGWEY